ncbi:MAG: CU044_5270 family protein, partial [Candidatus Limnocylindrales bacterium]|nr:CU044_5270 family protein [Candidatus Limnocylindrales bacterium]
DIAAAQPAGSGVGYRHTKSEGAYLSGVGGWPDHPNGVWALVPVSREIWIKSDGSGRIVESRGEPIWFGPADRAEWQAEGSPDLRGTLFSDTRFGPTSPGAEPGTPQAWPGSLYYQNVDALPTDVGALRHMIDERAAAGGGATDYERFTIVGDLLRETVAAPMVRAALYRVAASLNGVKLVGSMTDRAGRTGTAVSMTNDQSSRGLERRVLIFDPQTSSLLAEEDVLLHKVDWLDAEPPLVIGYNTYLVSDIVPTIP